MMKTLTRAEEEIMQVLWQLGKGFVKDIIKELPSPKPAYNTVSTIIRILERKNFVYYKAFGKTHQYYPLISKEKYSRFCLNTIVKGYFNGSFQNLVSFFVKDKGMRLSEFEELLKEIRKTEALKG